MKKWIDYNKELFFVLIAVIVLLIVPLCVYGLSVPSIFPGGNNDWSGFWGGYLGAVYIVNRSAKVVKRAIHRRGTSIQTVSKLNLLILITRLEMDN